MDGDSIPNRPSLELTVTSDPSSPLDMKTINELSAMLENGVYELFDEYIRTTEQLLKELEFAARQEDSEAVRHLAHTLKGSSGNLGIANVYQLSKVLEQEAGKGEGLEVAYDKFKEIEQAFLWAHEALSALMPEKL